MRWSVLGVLTFVLAGVAVAAPKEGSSVIGRVLTPDGKPAARATVWLVANRWEVGHITVESTALTDAQGNFRLPFKPPLRVFSAYVIAHHPNFAVGWQSFDPRDLKPLTVHLRHPAPLAGIVLTPDGKPLAKAKLQVWGIGSVRPSMAFEVTEWEFSPLVFIISEEMPEEVSPFWTVTDSHGRFVFQNLPANAQVSLQIHHPDYSLSRIPPPSEWFPLQTGREWVTLVAVPKSFLKGQVLR
ncbi:MAG: carboxypeptidase-like regulatory domain-containing protein, partial [Candidatus Bathyarchaeia archaeon]